MADETRTFTINPLGDTERERWENMVRIYCMSIRSCMDDAYTARKQDRERRLDAASDSLNSLESEVIKFMEQAFDIFEEERA